MIRTTYVNGINPWGGSSHEKVDRVTTVMVAEYFRRLGRPGTSRDCATHYAVPIAAPSRMCKMMADKGHLVVADHDGYGNARRYTYVSTPTYGIRDLGIKILAYLANNPLSSAREIGPAVGAKPGSVTNESLLRLFTLGRVQRKRVDRIYVYWVLQ